MTEARLGFDIDSSEALRAAADLQKLSTQAKKTGNDVAGMATKSSTGFNKLGGSFRNSGSQARDWGLILGKQATNIQNVGYQVGDFAVQIGSGTSAMRAFSQQAPQLLGSMGIWGAVAGAAVAVTSVLAMSFLEASGESISLTDATDDLSDSSQKYFDLVSDRKDNVQELMELYGHAAEEAHRLVRAQEFLAQAKAFESFSALGQAVKDTFELTAAFDEFGKKARGGPEEIRKLSEMFGIAADKASVLLPLLVAFHEADGLEEQSEAARALQQGFDDAGLSASDVTKEAIELMEAVAEGVLAANRLGLSMDAAAQATQATKRAGIDLTSALRSAGDEAVRVAQNMAEASGQALRLQEIRRATVGSPADRAAQTAVASVPTLDADEINNLRPGQLDALVNASTEVVANARLEAEIKQETLALEAAERERIRELSKPAKPTSSRGGGRGGMSDADKARLQAQKDLQRQIVDMAREADREREKIEREAANRVESLNSTLAGSFSDMFMGAIEGANSFQDALSGVLARLGEMAISNAFEGIMGGLNPATGGGGVAGGIFGVLGSLFTRNAGGPVEAGRPYWVGEGGAEMFIPDRPGRIATGKEAGGGGGGRVEIVLGPGLESRILDKAAEQSVNITRSGISDFNRAMPDRMSEIKRGSGRNRL